MTLLLWVVVACLSALIGAAVMRYLVVPPLEMSRYLAAAFIAAFVLLAIVFTRLTPAGIAASVLTFVVFAVAGYLAANARFLRQVEERQLPAVTRSPGAHGGHTAVVYFTHGEPPAYSVMPWIATFQELDADKAPFIPFPFRPFFFSGVRRLYLEVGGSPHNKVHRKMLDSLERAMPDAKKQGVKFYLAFLDSDPRPDEMAIRAVNEGAKRIILCAVFLTDSSHTLAGKKMVDDLHLEKHGVTVTMTKALWNSEPLQQMVVARADRSLDGTPRDKVGILLVGHGQPDGWDRIYPTQTEQEDIYRHEVAKRLVGAGYKPENVALAWMEFKNPRADEKASEMVKNGVEKILIYPASISADAIHSDIQIPKEVAKAKIPPGVEVINLGAWGDDPFVIEAIRQRIEERL